jgi:Flp pilus assembly CpaE family ATPase
LWVDYTVVDVGFSLEHDEEISTDLFAPRRNAAGITSLREADRVIAVGAADPVGLSRFLRAHVDLIETVAEGRVLVVMNKLRASAIGTNPSAQVAQTLSRFGGIEAAALIPYDSAAMDAAILSGRTLADAASRSPARQAIRELVNSRLVPTRAGKKRSRELRLA